MISESLKSTLLHYKDLSASFCFLTGAGVSAESGIRTFRGEDGYWTIGSDVYTPQEIATHKLFSQFPEKCWEWYLLRFFKCKGAEPNAGHFSLEQIERTLNDNFSLVTQNIDGLHLKAGSSDKRTFQIHGNINKMRCSEECCLDLFNLPNEVSLIEETKSFSSIAHLLKCPECGAMSRPHVLWFDEYYTEEHYRSESALNSAFRSDVLVVAGTTLLTSLPAHIVEYFANTHKTIIGIDIERNTLAKYADRSHRGEFILAKSSEALSEISKILSDYRIPET
ncbi:MAG: hypothetical protein NE334_06400 [Lentisphaeraceae bacterium]|nr:hypothetical protein [Lentisphaeraceae bacterium]